MNSLSRLAAAVIAGALLAGAPAPLAGWAQTAPPSTVPLPQLLAPNAGPGDVVHSWTIAPAINDVTQGGSRPNLSYEVPPGTEFSDKVTLFNLGNAPLTFKVYATDAFNTSDGSFELLQSDKKPTDIGSWVVLPQDTVSLTPKTQVTMPINIKVPVTAAPGDHVGGIIASSEAQSETADGKLIGVDRRTAVNMYVRVAGPLSPKLTVKKLSAKYRPSLNPFAGRTEVTFRIVNEGNVRTGGHHQVTVSAPLGLAKKQKGAVTAPELLPGQGADVRVAFKGVVASGIAVARVTLEPAPFGQAPVPTSAWRSVTLAPPVTVLALFLVVGLLLYARRALLRRQSEAGKADLAAQ